MMRYSGPDLQAARRQKFLQENRQLSNSLIQPWDALQQQEKDLYEQAAKRATYFKDLREGLKILDPPIEMNDYDIRSYKQLRAGQHLSYPMDLVHINSASAAGVPYLRHHLIINKVFIRDQSISVTHFSGANKQDAVIKEEIINIREKMEAGVLKRHDYKNVKPYKTKKILERAQDKVGSLGVYGTAYHIVNNNCEQAATFMRIGLAFSQQSGVSYYPN